jgi:sugar-specific transcriptional regulator TrmB
MRTRLDTCKQFRRLHDQLTEELRFLKERRQEMQQESFENPIETVNVIRSLQEVLNTVNDELAKCPPEDESSEAEKPHEKGSPRPFKR